MSARSQPRRRAEKPARQRALRSRAARTPRESTPKAPRTPRAQKAPRETRAPRTPTTGKLSTRLGRITLFTIWLAVALTGAGLLCVAMADLGPTWLPGVGAVIVSTAYTWAICARTGGRPVVYSLLALILGGLAIGLDREFLRGGAAACTAVLTAVLAVISTVPAARFSSVVREVLVATTLAAGGALAVVGFEPHVALQRFEYTTFGLGVLLCLGIVQRLGAGLHGLGRRGLVVVVVGSVLLAVALVYAETLRHYGSPGLVEAIDDLTRWSRDTLGATPRPLQFALGIPALAWGVHMRARRRQGWWVCAYGTAGTVSIANTLVRPRDSLLEAGLTDFYSLVLGLLIGYVVIRLDLALTGPRGARARRAEEARAIRPEPRRTSPLL